MDNIKQRAVLGWVQSVDWTTGLDYWTGLLDWTTGLARIAVKRLLMHIEAF